MTPDQFGILHQFLTILLSVGVLGSAGNALLDKDLSQNQKLIAGGIGLVGAVILAFLNNIDKTKFIESPAYSYVIIGVSSVFGYFAAFFLYKRVLKQLEDPLSQRKKLLREIEKEVQVRRKNNLHRDYKIPLSGISKPYQLETKAPPKGLIRNIQVKVAEETRMLDRSITDWFAKADIDRRLLIIGEPGSGKTTELLDLAALLCEEARKEPKAPIPIIFELSEWQPSYPNLNTWMVYQLQIKYNVEPEMGKDWLHRNLIFPLLDGLDELRDEMSEAIVAINKMQQDKEQQHQNIVICSRCREYENCEESLNLKTALYLKPLRDEQIHDYLQQHFRGDKFDIFWNSLKKDKEGLLELARQPLLLDLMPTAYPEGVVPDITVNSTASQSEDYQKIRLHQLLDAYILQAIQAANESGYGKKTTQRYITWLAKKMREQGKTEFLVEYVQPSWLKSTRERRLFQWGRSLIAGVTSGVILSPVFGGYGLLGGLVSGLVTGGIGEVIFKMIKQENKIEFAASFDISLLNIKKSIGFSFISALVGIMVFGLIGGITLGSMLGLIFGINFGIVEGFKSELKFKKYPGQVIWESLKKSGVVSLVSSLIWIAGWWSINLVLQKSGQSQLFSDDIQAVWWGLSFGLWMGALFGGLVAVLQYYLLRFMLYRKGVIPWNYRRFLEDASQWGILKKSGARFRFYHDLLREHFAGTL